MQRYNDDNKAHRTRVAEIIATMANTEDGVLWADLMEAIKAEFTVTNWLRIREVLQFLKDKSLIKRTDNIHEERFVKAAIGKPEGEFTLLVADSDGSDATEVISGSAEEIRGYIKRFGVPAHLCYVVDNKTGKLANDFKWSGQAKGAVDYDHMVWVSNRLGKAGFIGKFKKGEESGVFYYRGIPVELRLGNENLYLTLPDIYSKESHGDIIDALAQFLSKVLDSGGAGKTRR